MDHKLIGSTLLIVGTSIGAGMLALPIATAQLGFVGSSLLLVICWFVMTSGAFLLLEVNLWLPQNSNLNTMAKATLGPLGQIISWAMVLLLLNSLLCAYIAGGSDLFHNLLSASGVQISLRASTIIFTGILGSVVYIGIHFVDYVNRGLMFIKLAAYILLISLLTPSVSFEQLGGANLHALSSVVAITVTLTAFGYAAIVPSLRIYFASDVAKLKKAILIGSLIPLVCYLLWDAVIMGVIPLTGSHSLTEIMHSTNSTSDLVNTISQFSSGRYVTLFARLFTSICVLTSFLGVALCLTDFWADGLHREKRGGANLLIHSATFFPPLIIVLFFPHIFVKALEYAGIYCIILLVLLPTLMAWRGRYQLAMGGGFRVAGGKPLLMGLIISSMAMLAYSFTQ